ncbi:MAG: hypothetical protein ABIS30_10200, partial [Gallionella sp.]
GTNSTTGQPTYTPIYKMGTASVIGQSDIALNVQVAQLTDNDAATPAPQAITVSAQDGAAISADTGETVLIGAGALKSDAAVSISRIDINNLQAMTGMAAPVPGVLQSVGAFHLNLGDTPAQTPVQFVIPLQDTAGVAAGDEIYFLQRGKIVGADGLAHDTWWIMDNGFVGADANGNLVARTASPPYPGFTTGGDILLVTNINKNAGTGAVTVTGSTLNTTFYSPDAGLSSLVWNTFVSNFVISWAVGTSWFSTLATYDGAYQTQVTTTTDASGNTQINIPQITNPNTLAPDAPQITSMQVTGNGTSISIEGFGLSPNTYGSLYAWLRPEGSSEVWSDALRQQQQPVINEGMTSFAWQITAQAMPAGNDKQSLVINLPPDLSAAQITLAMHELVLVRVDKTGPVGQPNVSTRTILSGALPIEGPPSATVVSDGRNIRIYQNLGGTATVQTIPLADEHGNAIFAGGYKADQIAMSAEGDVAFIAGMKGQIYVFDMTKLAVTATINISAAQGQNISSLAVSQGWLYAAIGGRYSSGGGQLFRLNIAPYHYQFGTGAAQQTLECPLFNIQHIVVPADSSRPAGSQGYFDLAISNDGRYLAVTEPREPIGLYGYAHTDRGNAFVIDLSDLNRYTFPGDALILNAAAVKTILGASLPSNTTKGYGAQYIASGDNPGEFILSTAKDYTSGVFFAKTTDSSGRLLDQPTVVNLSLAPPDAGPKWYAAGVKYKLDIQRASGVAISADDKYAFVADYNMVFNEPNWLDGSTVGKQTGGKIAIIKDPFGTAEFLGTTTPIVGASIDRLTLSADGTQLIADLKDWGVNLTDPVVPGMLVWNVGQLINAAENNSFADQGPGKAYLPVDRTGTQNSNTQTVTPARYNGTGWIFGIASTAVKDIVLSAPPSTLANSTTLSNGTIRFGDVGRFDLAAAIRASGVSATDITGFQVLKDPTNALLVTNANTRGNLVDSINAKDIVTDTINSKSTFDKTGVLYLAPTITDQEETILRAGGKLPTKMVELVFQARVDGQFKVFRLKVNAGDYASAAGAVFFGDRDLSNPGYSKFELSGEVKVRDANAQLTAAQELDIWRVEQRLKYLGYTAFGIGTTSDVLPVIDPNTKSKVADLAIPKEFVVDGKFGQEEQSALRAFYADTHYSTYQSSSDANISPITSSISGNYGMQTTNGDNEKTVSPVASNPSDPNDDNNFEWLNAYNAPHWVNVYNALGIPTDVLGGQSRAVNGVSSFKDGTSYGGTMEIYSTSWVLDLLKGWEKTKQQLVDAGLIASSTQLQLNGLTDPEYFSGSHDAGGHSIGMSIDVGLGPTYISKKNQNDLANGGILPLAISGSGPWSIQNAIGWSAVLPYDPSINQSGALLNFLSLYAVTQSGSANGTWDNLTLVNGENRSALYGSGAENASQLIQHVWIGGTGTTNPYTGINAVLDQLGFSANGLSHAKYSGHQTHFHIDLRALNRMPIVGTHNLLVGDISPAHVPPSEAFVGNAQSLLDQVKTEMGLTQGEVTMFIPDMPNVPPQYVPVMIAQANQAQANDTTTTRTIGVCDPSPNNNYSLENVIEPVGEAGFYLRSYEHQQVRDIGTVTVLQQPKHGVLRLVTEADRGTLFDSSAGPLKSDSALYAYLPEQGYLGNDKAVMLVDIAGVKVKVVYFFKAVGGPLGNYGVEEFCGKRGYHWKISSTLDANGNSTITSVDYQSPVITATATVTDTAALAATLETSVLSNLTLNTSAITLNIANLPGGAVGQTVSNVITLDDNAAGNNWFIDPTPVDNSEFLPTSNPNEWVAKAGSAAYGKMDMLSVLLHEYGHALGIEHSGDGHDYMGTTLTPGVRRLPSAGEL